MTSENQTDLEPPSEPASVLSVIEPAQSPVAVNQTKTLDDYAKSIVESHNTVETAHRLSKKHGREAITAAINAGQQLIAAKELVGHGNWLKWIEDNCEGITPRTAQNYMKLATTKHVAYLSQATSLRQAYIVAGVINVTAEDKNPPAEPEKVQESGDAEDADGPPAAEVEPTHVQYSDKEILWKLDAKITNFEQLAVKLSQGLTDYQYDTCDVDDVPLHFALEKLKASLQQLRDLITADEKQDPDTWNVAECSTTERSQTEGNSYVGPGPLGLRKTEQWIDLYMARLREPFTFGVEKRYLKDDYVKRTEEWFKDEKRFNAGMRQRNGFLFRMGIWPTLPQFTKKYVAARVATAPLCEGGCGKRLIGFSDWGEVDPFLRICHRCKKKQKSG